MSSIQLMNPSDDAKKWRDISPENEQCELYTRIALAVGLAVLLVGIAVAMYYCFTTSSSQINNWGNRILISNAPFAVIPGIFGSMGAAGLVVGLIFSDFEKGTKNFHSEDVKENTAERNAVHSLLTTGSFDDVYNRYHKRNGGIGPLVRNGMLTIAQGQELQSLFKGREEQTRKKKDHERQDPSYVEAIKAKPENDLAYKAVVDAIAAQDAQMKTLQAQIAANFKAA